MLLSRNSIITYIYLGIVDECWIIFFVVLISLFTKQGVKQRCSDENYPLGHESWLKKMLT